MQNLLDLHSNTLSSGQSVALLLMDIDKLPQLFDLCGPAGVESLLDIVTQERLTPATHGTLAELAPGRIACLVPYEGEAALSALTDRLRQSLAEPIWIGRHIIHLTASIGVAVSSPHSAAETLGTSGQGVPGEAPPLPAASGTPFLKGWESSQDTIHSGTPAHSHDCAEREERAVRADYLLHAASVALSHAKNAGQNTVRRFEDGMFQLIRRQLELESDFRNGLLLGQVIPFYQPIVLLDSAEPKGFEALARWQHPVHGLVSPNIFMPMARDLNLGSELLLRMLRQVCSDAQKWAPHLTVSINISPAQLCDAELTQQVLKVVYASGLDPSRLIVEITEETSLINSVAVAHSIQSFRKAGMSVALDDFGTGHAGFERLSRLEIDHLKIDRTLIRAMNTERGRLLVKGIAALGSNLMMKVTAEGIETAEQARLALEAQCNWGQGFLYKEAVPAEAVNAFLTKAKPSLHALV